MAQLLTTSKIYPTNNFGRHNNVHFYFYNRYVTQGNNWCNYGLHQVEFRNDTDSNVEIVGWTMKEGRVEEDFKSNVVRPGLFYTARLVPNSWGTYKSIIGALTVKVQGTNQCYTFAFEDPFHDYVHSGYKGSISQGSNANEAISNLKDCSSKSFNYGRYDFQQFDGRGKSIFTLGNSTGRSTSTRVLNSGYIVGNTVNTPISNVTVGNTGSYGVSGNVGVSGSYGVSGNVGVTSSSFGQVGLQSSLTRPVNTGNTSSFSSSSTTSYNTSVRR